jgi:adenylate cyclase class 2
VGAEIEVKYRVEDVDDLLRALEKRGIRLSAPVRQDDQAYAPASWGLDDSRIGVTFARLRMQAGRCVFTTKTPVDNVLACREFETDVTDREQMHAAILAMGYRPTVRVVKTRRTAQVGSFALCVDDVSGAGAYLEVEAVADHTDDMSQVQDQLARWVDSLGVAVERTGATYDAVVSGASAAV